MQGGISQCGASAGPESSQPGGSAHEEAACRAHRITNLQIASHTHAKLPLQVRRIIVPTVDSARYTHLLNLAIQNGYPCLLVGPTGTGKSVYTLRHLSHLPAASFAPHITIGMSARTTAAMTQQMVDAKLDRRRKGAQAVAVDMLLPQESAHRCACRGHPLFSGASIWLQSCWTLCKP